MCLFFLFFYFFCVCIWVYNSGGYGYFYRSIDTERHINTHTHAYRAPYFWMSYYLSMNSGILSSRKKSKPRNWKAIIDTWNSLSKEKAAKVTSIKHNPQPLNSDMNVSSLTLFNRFLLFFFIFRLIFLFLLVLILFVYMFVFVSAFSYF